MSLGHLFALCTTLLWTMSALCFEAASKRVGSMAVNLLRLLVAMVLLGCLGLAQSGNFIPTHASAHQWNWLLLSGAIGFFLGDLALFRAYVLIGSRLTTLLMVLSAPFAAITALWWLDEKLSMQSIIGMMVVLAGVAWVCLERNEKNPLPRHHVVWGVVLGIIAAIGQGVGGVLTKVGMFDPSAAVNPLNPFDTTQIRILAGIAGFCVAIPAMRRSGDVIRATRHPAAMGFLILGALVGPALGVSCYNASLERIPAGVTNTIASMVPVTIIPFAILIKREHVSLRAIVGAMVAIVGVALLCLSNGG